MEITRGSGIVIVGAQKAATSAFSAALARHPDVSALSEEFFGFVERADDEVTLADLQTRFARLPQREHYAFKCASYLAEPGLPQRIRATLGPVHVVAMVRNPVDRAVSAWYWYVLCGMVPLLDHEIGLRLLMAGAFDLSEWPHAHEVLDWGEYDRLLAPWIATFGPDRVHVLGEGVTNDLDAAMSEFTSSLGLRPVPAAAITGRRANPGIYSLTRLRWLRLRLRWRWRNGRDGIRRFERPTHPLWWVLDAAITAVDRIVLRPICRKRVVVTPQLRGALIEHYRVARASWGTTAPTD